MSLNKLISRDPVVRIAVMVVSDGKMLMGLRGKDWSGQKWCFPSSELRINQDFRDCATSAVYEQSGLRVNANSVITATNDVYMGLRPRHEVTLYIDATKVDDGDVPVLPVGSRYTEWKWFKLFHPPDAIDISESNFFKSNFTCVGDAEDLDFEFFGIEEETIAD